MKRRLPVLLAVCAALAAAVLWYLYGARTVPAGQQPMTVLSATHLDVLRSEFNREPDKTRVILLLSPT
jgi:hypothetical protein